MTWIIPDMVKENTNPVDADQIEADPERPRHRKSEVGRGRGRHSVFERGHRGQKIDVGSARRMTPCERRPDPHCDDNDDDELRHYGPLPVTDPGSPPPPLPPPTTTATPAALTTPPTAADDNNQLSLLFCAACRLRQERSLSRSASGQRSFIHVTTVSASYRHAITGCKQASGSCPVGDVKSADYRSHEMDHVGDVCHAVQDDLPLLRLVQGQLLSRDIIKALYAEYYNDIKVPRELCERLDSRFIDPGRVCSHHGNGQVTSRRCVARDSAMNGAHVRTRICESFKADPATLSDSGYSSLERDASGIGESEPKEDAGDGRMGRGANAVEHGADDVIVTMDANTYTREKLNQRSKDMLTVLKDQFSTLIQVVSEELVRLLEERHELKEQVEMRKIAVEQLARLHGNAVRKESPTDMVDRLLPAEAKHRTRTLDIVRSAQSLDMIHNAESLHKAHMTQSLYTIHSTQSLDNVHNAQSLHAKHDAQSLHGTHCTPLHRKIPDTQSLSAIHSIQTLSTKDDIQSHDKRRSALPSEAMHDTQCSVLIHTTQTADTVPSAIHSAVSNTIQSTPDICGGGRHHVLIGSDND